MLLPSQTEKLIDAVTHFAYYSDATFDKDRLGDLQIYWPGQHKMRHRS
jgi:hypothetical protein